MNVQRYSALQSVSCRRRVRKRKLNLRELEPQRHQRRKSDEVADLLLDGITEVPLHKQFSDKII